MEGENFDIKCIMDNELNKLIFCINISLSFRRKVNIYRRSIVQVV